MYVKQVKIEPLYNAHHTFCTCMHTHAHMRLLNSIIMLLVFFAFVIVSAVTIAEEGQAERRPVAHVLVTC